MRHSEIHGPSRWPLDYYERIDAAKLAVEFCDIMARIEWNVSINIVGSFCHPQLTMLQARACQILESVEQENE